MGQNNTATEINRGREREGREGEAEKICWAKLLECNFYGRRKRDTVVGYLLCYFFVHAEIKVGRERGGESLCETLS